MKAIVGVWKDDLSSIPQLYEFKSWGEVLDFYKQQRKNFTILYHFVERV